MVIGLFDSGIGGLTVLQALRTALPHERFVYLGDTARSPYGTKGRETIVRYARECAAFLMGKEVEILVVACNTASAQALGELREELPCPVIGTIDQAVRKALAVTRGGKIGVIGTEGTIGSGAYQEAFRTADSNVEIFPQICPLFVPLVEQGMLSGDIVERVVELYLAPLKKCGVDTLVLGCTHYPLLISELRSYLGEEVEMVECSKTIADEIVEMRGQGSLPPGTGSVEYFTTDDRERFKKLAALFLGEAPHTVTTVEDLSNLPAELKLSYVPRVEPHRSLS